MIILKIDVTGGRKNSSSQIQSDLETLYVPLKSRFLIIKLQNFIKIRDRNIFIESD